MKFRAKAFGLHILSSACVLGLVWLVLYLGWYRWPGWYLTGVVKIAALMAGVDVVLGPLLTLLIANPSKPRRELVRDIGIIVAVQIVALLYGSSTLWAGRPLYYAYSEKWLEVVQASDLSGAEIERARQENAALAPYWYSLPRWVWAPLPQDPTTANEIVSAAISGGSDVTQMPRYFKPYAQAASDMRAHLKPVAAFGEFTGHEKQVLQSRMLELGLPAGQPVGMVAMGRGRPLLAVFDPQTMRIVAWIAPR